MPRTPRRYAVHLHLVGGQTERVFFPKLETFQEWYQGGCQCGDSGRVCECADDRPGWGVSRCASAGGDWCSSRTTVFGSR